MPDSNFCTRIGVSSADNRRCSGLSRWHPADVRRILAAAFAVVLLLGLGVSAAQAQSRGKISGKVVDASGESLPGVNILISEGVGTATDIDGDYFIANVEPGRYSVRASFVGFREVVVEDVRVVTGQTTVVDIVMHEEVIEGGEVIITATRPLIEKDNTTSLVVLGANEIATRPTTDFTEVLTSLPSINIENGQVRVRGGGLDQVAFVLDGARVRNPADHSPYTRINLSSIQEVEVITGAFNAEYGEAQSGVINVITKDGSEGYSMYVDTRIRPPGVRHWGSGFYDRSNPLYWENTHALHLDWWEENPDQWTDPNGIKGIDPRSEWTADEAYQHYLDTHQPLTDYDTAVMRQTEIGLGGAVPGVSGLSFFFTGKHRSEPPLLGNAYRDRGIYGDGTLRLAYRLPGGRKLSFSGFYGSESAGWGYYPDFFWMEAFSRDSRYAYYDLAGLDHVQTQGQSLTYTDVVDAASMYEVRLSRLYAFRKNDVFPDDPIGFDASDAQRDNVQAIDEHGNPVPPYRIGHNTAGYLARYQNRNVEWTASGYYSNQLEKYWHLKTGAEISVYSLDHYNHSKFPSPSTDDHVYEPVQGAAYVQNKFEFGGLITNVGLRLDFYDANEQVFEDPFNPIAGESSPSPLHMQLSPRVGVSHPIDERTKLHFSYGHFFQRPNFFDNGEGLGSAAGSLSTMLIDGTEQPVVLGNRNLKPRKTISFEVGIERNFWDFFVVDLTGFYKDSRNTIRTVEVNTPAGTYRTNGNGDYGDVRGVEVSLRKVPSSYAWGTISGYASYTSRIQIEGRSGDPVAITPNRVFYGPSGDNILYQNPRLKAGLHYEAPQFGGILGTAFGGLSVSTDYVAVHPNRNIRSDIFVVDGETFVRPVDHSLNLRARKIFSFRDGEIRLSPYLEVQNLLNDKWILLSTMERASIVDQRLFVDSGFTDLPERDANNVPILDVAKYRNLPRSFEFGITLEL